MVNDSVKFLIDTMVKKLRLLPAKRREMREEEDLERRLEETIRVARGQIPRGQKAAGPCGC